MDYRLSTYAQPGALIKVSELNAYGQTAVICRDEHDRYWGIPSRFLENGRLIRPVNGILGNISETLSQCLEATTQAFHMDALIADGADPVVAALMLVHGMTREAAEAHWRSLQERAKDNG